MHPMLQIKANTILGPASYRGSGFLHSITANVPTDSLLVPLKPKLFRSNSHWIEQAYDRMSALGATVQLVMSDHWSWEWGCPGDDGDWSTLEDHIRNRVTTYQSKGYQLQWDIWNEPDLHQFWKCDPERYPETFSRAFRIIKEMDPDAVVVGPSYCCLGDVKTFLLHCKKENTLPDIITWHDFNSRFRRLEEMVLDIQTWLTEQSIPQRPIQINEWINGNNGHHDQFRPGVAIQYLAQAERVQIDGACHACWEDEQGRSHCSQASLDGLITMEQEPRSTWYAFKAYADITGKLLKVIPNEGIDGIAGYDPEQDILHLLISNTGIPQPDNPDENQTQEEDTPRDVRIRITDPMSTTGWKSGDTIHITIDRLANSGPAPSSGFSESKQETMILTEDVLSFTIPAFPSYDGYRVKITNPTDS